MKRWIEDEAMLASKVVAELQRQGFKTYEEVSTGYGAKRADIVALRGPVVAVVECKVSFSMKLTDQLTGWLGLAHVVIGACGFTKLGIASRRYLRREGIGLWMVGFDEIREEISPRLLRRADTRRIKRDLCPEMKSGEYAKAGTQGGYWTPFQATCRDLKRVVAEHDGIELRAALKAIKHHYANERSAVSSIPDIIKRGLLDGIVCEGRPLRLYSRTVKPALVGAVDPQDGVTPV